MMHDFDFKGAAEMPYNPMDYNLPIWRDEDHLPPQETVTAEAETQETGMTIEQAKYKLLSYAMDQLGHRENGDNWNEYAAMPDMMQLLGWDAQNQPWCNIFVNACFIACFGLEIGAAMLYQPVGSGSALCRASADFFKSAGAWIERGRTPEPGDVIFFFRNGDINHMGIVSRVAGGSVVTIEGNSSDSVAERVYSVNDSTIAGYGRPDWAVVEGKDINVPTDNVTDIDVGDKPDEPRSYALSFPYLSKGDTGDIVWAVQTLLQARNIYCGPWGADSDFGSGTEKGVRDFQRRNGLTPDGVVGPDTGAALFGGEVYTPEESAPEANSFWNNLLTKIRK